MPHIQVAEQPGVGLDGRPRPTEDYVVVLDNAVVLLDGATSTRPGLPSGGWYADKLSTALAQRLRAAPDADLADVLADAIAEVATDNGLRARSAPSSTVAMLRWCADRVDALVLADSPIVVFTTDGMRVISDDRLADLRAGGQLQTGGAVHDRRNTAGGFWVAEADPDAATHAVRASWPVAEVRAVLMATDGVSVGVDEYRVLDWETALDLATRQGPAAVLDVVREAELADPDGDRWPRAKRHDDQALVLLRFD
ncbi:hypothetical protein [Amycolatopsis suaedae]|uniref:Protein phosphatase 2C domain-containing protein n=1 Tax=Amycolatopsis suaedae TaxID=2510978 RepID=A0A4Q7J9B1_9PSEU|nr:hypothetical protein [Amycolatopsis suaedae]RZQ64341.1 hypothetical protein EWH70_10245 [Amycolatopsis suaedae]